MNVSYGILSYFSVFDWTLVSPECLDEVEQYLAPIGVMIPTNYTSFIAPITASRVWMGARDMPSHKGG